MPTDDRTRAAHRWMGALPRDKFDLLLLLFEEMRQKERREGLIAILNEIDRIDDRGLDDPAMGGVYLVEDMIRRRLAGLEARKEIFDGL